MVETPGDGNDQAQVRLHELVLGALDHRGLQGNAVHKLTKSLVVGREAKPIDWPPQFGRTIQTMDLRHRGIDEYSVDVQFLQLDRKAIHQFLELLVLRRTSAASGAR